MHGAVVVGPIMESLGEKQAKRCLTEFSAVPAYNPYKRIIGKIVYNEQDVNLAMVRAGYAWWYRKY